MNDSTSRHCGNKVNEVAIADWRNPHRSISVNNTAGEGDGVLNGEGARSTLMNLFHDRHVELDSVDMDMEARSLSRVMTLVDDTVSVQTPHSKSTEPRRRVQEIIARYTGEGDGVLNGEGPRSTLTNLFHDRHVELDIVDMGMEARSLSRVHPTNGGTMMTLVDDTVLVQTPHSKATEPRRRVQEIIARSQQQEMFDEIQWRQESGGDEVHGEFSDNDFDDLLLLAAESRGWIDELDINERKGCPFLIKNRGKVKNDQEKSLE
eukprot:CAMPEP_0171353670 /NCGR_PEP_ID=MMETSP0878-20121228/44311_1 /TAXON_ID=67004 /ORGANISM="Thalassiosira weissflogii, Strain CCMP1336" /LENGTH=262 /DNA_ID=CAMNT_0011859621 /DNA_START=116 /DNA_END=905 /DNA_ORIENTATION=-